MTAEHAEMASYSGPTENLSELGIILLGYKMSGKSSSGNTILRSDEFKLQGTKLCEKRQGVVAGRQVTVVNTPGWWSSDSLSETSERTKQEIVLSASLCPQQGPHALLLVLRGDLSDYKSIEEHMQLLGETVWSHTIILFTFGDVIGDRSTEHYIESEGEPLQRLVEKCGNRYHVFNNKNRGDDTQVTELLEKIEEMVARGTGGCFEIDRRVLDETEKKRRTLDAIATRLQTVTYTDYWSPSIPSLPLRKARSKDFPPDMSGADLQQRSLRSSLSGATSDYGSQSSISPYGSRSSISPYGSRSSISPYGSRPSIYYAHVLASLSTSKSSLTKLLEKVGRPWLSG